MTSTDSFWKDFNRPGSRTGYNGAFGDSFFSDCFNVVDSSATTSRSTRRVVHEDVATDVPDEKVKPMYRKSHLSRLSSDDVYQVMLEVSHFTPTDLTVKLVDDKTIVVEGKHGERKDEEGFVSREFKRKYLLPESVKPSTIECFLSSDGVLVIRGHADPRKSPFRDTMTTGHDSVIPVYTHGYRYDTVRTPSPGGERLHVQERIIPITKEDKPSTERPRSSTPPEHSRKGHKERTVSFTEEDNSAAEDLFSKSFSAATKTTSSATTTTTKPLTGGVSWTIPVNGKGTIEEIEDPIVINPDPTYKRNGGVSMTIPVTASDSHSEHPEEDPYIVTSGRSSRASRSPIHTPTFNESVYKHSDGHQPEPMPSTSKGTSSTSDKNEWRKSRRHEDHADTRRDRHFSSESRNEFTTPSIRDRHFSSDSRDRLFGKTRSSRFMNDSDLFSSARKLEQEIEERFGRPLIHRDRDLFASDFGFSSVPPLPRAFSDFKDIPLKSNEESYEKNFEKGYNKEGHWEETFQEKFHSEKYASWSSNDRGISNGTHEAGVLMDTNQPDPHNEHMINISSAA